VIGYVRTLERSALGNGRTYTIQVTATGAGGDTTTVPVNVLVPHDSGM